MAINRFMKAALKAISYANIDYKGDRTVKNNVFIPVLGRIHSDVTRLIELDGRRVEVTLYYPGETDSNEVLLFFHGGGWVSGSVNSYAGTCAMLSRYTGRRVVSVEYRLAPEFPFPYAADDCYTAAKKLIMDGTFFEVRPDDVILIGDSAGGNLAAAVSLMARDRGEFKINSQILLYPAVYNDHTESSPFPSVRENGTDYLLTSKRICEYMDLYGQSEEDKTNPYFAPYIAENLSVQPDTLIITAEFDPLRDEGEAYGKKLADAGNYAEIHRIPDALHGFFSLPARYTHVKQALGYINAFLGREQPDASGKNNDIRTVRND